MEWVEAAEWAEAPVQGQGEQRPVAPAARARAPAVSRRPVVEPWGAGARASLEVWQPVAAERVFGPPAEAWAGWVPQQAVPVDEARRGREPAGALRKSRRTCFPAEGASGTSSRSLGLPPAGPRDVEVERPLPRTSACHTASTHSLSRGWALRRTGIGCSAPSLDRWVRWP